MCTTSGNRALLCGFQSDLSARVVFGFTVSLLDLVEREGLRDRDDELAAGDLVCELIEA
jgi:hypothetical protein